MRFNHESTQSLDLPLKWRRHKTHHSITMLLILAATCRWTNSRYTSHGAYDSEDQLRKTSAVDQKPDYSQKFSTFNPLSPNRRYRDDTSNYDDAR